MHNYSLYCFDKAGSAVFRHSFEAEHNSEAKLIADAICDACSDEHHRFELWKDDLPIAGGKTAKALAAPGLSPRARQAVRHALLALINSNWRVSHSRRLSGQIGAWTEGESSPPADSAEQRLKSRRLYRGVEYTVHSTDGLRWTWLAYLSTADGTSLTGTLNGNKDDAITLCMAAIDRGLGPERAPAARAPASPKGGPQNGPWAAATAFKQAPAKPLTDARHVLIAEDENMFRSALGMSLEAFGFKVHHAADGREALEVLKQHPEIALLVSDIRMPHMDGYDLVEAGLSLRPDLKVILMTGYAPLPSKWALDHEIGTLRKPFDVDVLCRRASELVAVH